MLVASWAPLPRAAPVGEQVLDRAVEVVVAPSAAVVAAKVARLLPEDRLAVEVGAVAEAASCSWLPTWL